MKKACFVVMMLLVIGLIATKTFSAMDPNWRFVSYDEKKMACLRCDAECRIVIVDLETTAKYEYAYRIANKLGVFQGMILATINQKVSINDKVVSNKALKNGMSIDYAQMSWSKDNRYLQFEVVDKKGNSRMATYDLKQGRVTIF